MTVKHLTTFYDDACTDKAERRKKRQLDKAAKSSIMSFIRSEVSDRPEEQRTSGTNARSKADEHEQALEAFEEEHFVRVPLSKKERAQLKRRREQADDLMNVRLMCVLDALNLTRPLGY